METLLVDSRSFEQLLPAVGQALTEKGVEMRSCPQAKTILGDLAVEATSEDWDTEYLDLICSVRVVDGVEAPWSISIGTAPATPNASLLKTKPPPVGSSSKPIPQPFLECLHAVL